MKRYATRQETRAWASRVRVGDKLTPIGLYNKTERPPRQLKVPSTVLGVREDLPSQTGISFCVASNDGAHVWLDAAWFKDPTRSKE